MSPETFGQALRRWRTSRALSVRALAVQVFVSKSHLSELENGRRPQSDVAQRLDEILDAGGELIALARQQRTDAVVRSVAFDAYQHTDLAARLVTGGAGGVANMDRRSFVFGMGSVTALGALVPGLGLETLRHGVMLALAQERANSDTDEWREIVDEYGQDYLRVAPPELLQSLIVDLLGVQIATNHTPASGHRDLHRTGAYLAAFTAMTVANLGHTRDARRWWRSARHIAIESGDPDTILWVCGREVVRALYEDRPVNAVLALAERAEQYVPTATDPSVAQLRSGQAQALAYAGRGVEAVATLGQVRHLYDRMGESVAGEFESLFDKTEGCLRFTESFVYSYLGDRTQADAAQTRAIRLYPPQYLRGPAQIELQRALCLVKDGDASAGAAHALSVMNRLPRTDHIRPVVDLAHRVAKSAPIDDRHRSPASELRDYLGALAAPSD